MNFSFDFDRSDRAERTEKVRDREDALANTRDACATHNRDLLPLAIFTLDPDGLARRTHPRAFRGAE